ncbi:hypothetical protein DFA_04461 [Cavenderia fasciculata]|uniref:Uncharacterized protein n=1 Tax=Cavenderia fasciculata TaxID=261658 RepID=F4PPN0_CACFS|nr:uncharacterized protein DFA_04461 [Cavenderia fasciculata]EGG22343.1 hypothetical protein DFA_04461 [Cavenderia fasciculata]|eukprot:XP_004360194.1 hypothetical protein DFA_04461 [Cavenderia fasciculata]
MMISFGNNYVLQDGKVYQFYHMNTKSKRVKLIQYQIQRFIKTGFSEVVDLLEKDCFKIDAWNNLFKSRYNRTYHLRVLKEEILPVCFDYLEQWEDSRENQINLVKTMKVLDEKRLDDYRKEKSKEEVYLLESVVYSLISLYNDENNGQYLVDGYLMSLSRKKIKFQFHFISDSWEEIKIGSFSMDSQNTDEGLESHLICF